MTERFNCTILNMLSTVVLDDEHMYNLDLHLPTLMMAYRTSRHETTSPGATPFSLVYGREANCLKTFCLIYPL